MEFPGVETVNTIEGEVRNGLILMKGRMETQHEKLCLLIMHLRICNSLSSL